MNQQNNSRLNQKLKMAEKAYKADKDPSTAVTFIKEAAKNGSALKIGNAAWHGELVFSKKTTLGLDEKGYYTLLFGIKSKLKNPRSTLGSLFVFNVLHNDHVLLSTGVVPIERSMNNPFFIFCLGIFQFLNLVPVSNSTLQIFQMKVPNDVSPNELILEKLGVVILKGNRYPILKQTIWITTPPVPEKRN